MKRAVGILVSLSMAFVVLPAAAGAPVSELAIAYITGTATSGPDVWVASGSGSPHELGKGDWPTLAPDGMMVAVSDEGSSGPALSVYPAAGGAPKTYFDVARASARALAWSPDSRYVAVLLSSTHLPSLNGSGLAIIDTESGTYKMIAKGAIYGASFAPGSSDTLVYGRSTSLSPTAETNIFTVQANGSETKQITTNNRSLNPVWGSQGIAYDQEQLRTGFAPLYQIWTMSSNGSEARQITHVKVEKLVSGLVPIAFSSEGTRLAAEYEGQDTSTGYSVSVASGQATQLKVGNLAVSAWGLSSNGESVLISVGGFMNPPSRGKIEQIPFAGGHATVLVASGDDPSWNH